MPCVNILWCPIYIHNIFITIITIIFTEEEVEEEVADRKRGPKGMPTFMVRVNTKHLYNICTLWDQHRRRWADVVQMLCKCFVFAGLGDCHKLNPICSQIMPAKLHVLHS